MKNCAISQLWEILLHIDTLQVKMGKVRVILDNLLFYSILG